MLFVCQKLSKSKATLLSKPNPPQLQSPISNPNPNAKLKVTPNPNHERQRATGIERILIITLYQQLLQLQQSINQSNQIKSNQIKSNQINHHHDQPSTINHQHDNSTASTNQSLTAR